MKEEITVKDKCPLEELLEREMEYSKEAASRAGEPSYFFSVGDIVRCGPLPGTEILEVHEGGKFYTVELKKKKRISKDRPSKGYTKIVPWFQVRPIKTTKYSEFSENEDIRLHFYKASVRALISKHTSCGVDFSPSYGGVYKWSDAKKEFLLESIFFGSDIGAFVFKEKNDVDSKKDKNLYEIVDGKQRLLTILDFFLNRFPYRGVYYNDLSDRDREHFDKASVCVSVVSEMSKNDIVRLYMMLNKNRNQTTE